MSIRSSQHFIFNGERSDAYGITNVNIDSGLSAEPFAAARTIKEQIIRGRDKPYFFGLQKSPLEFSVTFAFEHAWDSALLRRAAKWLTGQGYYAPLQFSDNLNVIYYCLVVDSPELVHNGLQSGYVTLKFRCNGPYAYSPVYTSALLDYSANAAAGADYTFENLGDTECKPIVYIRKIGAGDDFKIINTSHGGQWCTVSGLLDNERLMIDFEQEIIETSIPLTYRYDNFEGHFLTMSQGANRLQIFGKCKLQWKYQFYIMHQ
ncbi:phage tail domain-containing protein [Paenibacillus sp. y28]|uniref:phage tail domain-containing protein n=1 Tax=Paenibacillus sp. y28 TaxID=3129110 RepID=UPI00301AD321